MSVMNLSAIQTDRQTDRHTDTQTYTQTDMVFFRLFFMEKVIRKGNFARKQILF